MNDILTINYEEFEEEGIVSLTVCRGEEALFMFGGQDAKIVREMLLTGNIGEFVRQWITK